MIALLSLALALAAGASPARAAEIDTNEVHMQDAPAWLKIRRVQKVIDQIGRLLEWDIHKVECAWYSDQAEFRRIHGFDDTVLAFTRRSDGSLHMGPRVSDANFDGVFGHELVHVIVSQKYKEAIPKWLEEGLANYLAKRGEVDYAWLAAQPARDVRTLNHPFSAVSSDGSPGSGARYHYMASRALAEMIAARCSLADVLQMAVGKSVESYLPTLCGIEDLNAEFRNWLKRKARAAPPAAKPTRSTKRAG